MLQIAPAPFYLLNVDITLSYIIIYHILYPLDSMTFYLIWRLCSIQHTTIRLFSVEFSAWPLCVISCKWLNLHLMSHSQCHDNRCQEGHLGWYIARQLTNKAEYKATSEIIYPASTQNATRRCHKERINSCLASCRSELAFQCIFFVLFLLASGSFV